MTEERKNKKDITCAVLYRYNNEFLICHATMTPWWTIPKGIKNNNEKLITAAIRELREETGIVLREEDLKLNGIFTYARDKDLALFEYKASKPLDTEYLICTSFFDYIPSGKRLPEVDRFLMVNLKEAKQKLNRNLFKIIRRFVR